MFKILDGRSQFYQWDLDRKVIVEDASVNEVHFCNRTDDCSLICEVYELDGLRVADVPNIMLQEDWRINVYAYDNNYTKHADVFEVVRRSKPADYVYTETEIKNYDDLYERVEQIEKNGVSDEAVSSAVEKYLEENDIQVDLTGYATEAYVNEKIETIELTPGPAGKDGYTPVKGVDYFDGEPGKDGADGQDYVLTEADKQEIARMVEVTGGEGSCLFAPGEGEDSIMTPWGSGYATGKNSLALGLSAKASGNGSVAIGQYSNAATYGGIAAGYFVSTSVNNQVVIGKCNTQDDNASFIIGTGSSVANARNGMTIDGDNVAHFPGNIKVGENDEEVATKAYVDAHAGGGGSADLSNYYTKSETDTAIQTAITTAFADIKMAEEGAY